MLPTSAWEWPQLPASRLEFPRCRANRSKEFCVMSVRPFHLAFPVHDLAAARAFYGGLLQCPEGRSSAHWVDFNLYGHQIVAHLAPAETRQVGTSAVDGDDV